MNENADSKKEVEAISDKNVVQKKLEDAKKYTWTVIERFSDNAQSGFIILLYH